MRRLAPRFSAILPSLHPAFVPGTRVLLALLVGTMLTTLLPSPLAPRAQAAHEFLPVWRVQLTVEVANRKNAGTDNPINAQLNDSNLTWMNYSRDDFKRGSRFSYDLNLVDDAGSLTIRTLGDITMLRLTKTGDDGVCLRSIELLVNGRSAYLESFDVPRFRDRCLWLDTRPGYSPTYVVPPSQLEAALHGFRQPAPPTRITRGEIESRVEGMVGHTIHGTDASWGRDRHRNGRAVKVSRRDATAVHVDVDLAYRIPGWIDPKVDVDFDLRFACSDGVITITTERFDVDANSGIITRLLTLGFIAFAERGIAERFERNVQTIMVALDPGLGSCPRITVQRSGDVTLSLF